MSLDKFLKIIDTDRQFNLAFANHERLAAQPSRFAEPIEPLPQSLQNALKHSGINHLYSHQAEAINLIRAGHNLVAITPTASGKSLLYNLPVLEKLAEDPEAHALYIFPLKALEQDQAMKLGEFIKAAGLEVPPLPTPAIAGGACNELSPSATAVGACDEASPTAQDARHNKGGVSFGIYDGDTPTSDRAKMRKSPPSILITNPDMLHLSIMGYHASWEDFLRGLKYVVIDELHVYRGVFGSHILHVLHRLDRLCRYYGAEPIYIATSATIAEAGQLAEQLTGLPFKLIEDSGAPLSKRHFIFFNPEDSYLTFALSLFATALKCGLKSIVFSKSRRTTELLHRWMNDAYPGQSKKISSYRAGFLPEERREIEAKLQSGELNGVITTSALELGIDIGGLDVCILVGYPGTIATTWQRAGRVGRGDDPSCVCLVAGQDQLDQYFMRNPSDFYARSVEKAVVDATNSFIAKPHLVCAAQEVPIKIDDPLLADPHLKKLVVELADEGRLLLGADGNRWFASQRRPQRMVNIRAAGDIVSIELERGGKGQLGSVSGRSVYAECHPGAIYLHRAQQYLVTKLDTLTKTVKVRWTDVKYYTVPLFEKETEILEVIKQKEYLPSNTMVNSDENTQSQNTVCMARLKVTEQLVGYQKRRIYGQQMISQHELEYPPTSYETIGLSISIPETALMLSTEKSINFRGGIHGIEHAMLALAPLFALCDRNDMGGYSTVSHPNVNGAAVFLYDGHPGGIGLSARLFDVFSELTERTLRLVEDCPCKIGCPSCIHSPKCGHGNIPLDKASTVLSLEVMTGRKTIKPSKLLKLNKTKPASIKENPKIASKIISPIEPATNFEDLSGVVFDLETQRSADEVGGWGNIKSMGLAWGVVYRFPDDEWLDFEEKDAERLVEVLSEADLVVGFNQIKFDYEVLRGYSGFNFRSLNSYDILVEINKALGHRLKMDSVATATLGVSKSADGLQSLKWWRDGEKQKVAKYCRQDVKVTRDLFFHIIEKEYLLFEKKGVGLVKIPLKFKG
jgi:DEAD/DEAH box helicase domain-containing protein